MQIQLSQWLSIIVVVTAVPNIALSDATRFEIAASKPIITLIRDSNSRTQLSVPAIEFVFQIKTQCASSRVAKSVLLSIADTKKRVLLEPTSDNTVSELVLKVPARQIAPLPVAGYCTGDNNYPTDRTLTIRGVLSAQGALSCMGEEDEVIAYASKSLDIEIRCEDLADGESSDPNSDASMPDTAARN